MVRIVFLAVLTLTLNLSHFGQSRPSYLERLEARDKRDANRNLQSRSVQPFFLAYGVDARSGSSPGSDKAVRKKILKLSPSSADITSYKPFLQQEQSGVIRLIPETPCTTKKGQHDRLASECGSDSNLGGGGTFFSFNKERYTSVMFSEVGFEKMTIFVSGLLNQGFLTDLGEVPIESVGNDHLALSAVNKVSNVQTVGEMLEQGEKLDKGIVVDGFTFTEHVAVTNLHTYIGRIVAYRPKSVKLTTQFGEFKIPDRKDSRDYTLVFKVISVEKDGSVTLIYKKLGSIESPQITL